MALSQLKKVYDGSVKDLYEKDNTLIFNFSDRYSIYDWGQMPDLIDNKGAALASCGRLFVEQIESAAFWQMWDMPEFLDEKFESSLSSSKTYSVICHEGLKTNFIAQLDDDLNPSDTGNNLQVRKVDVLRPTKENGVYDYSAYKANPTNTLIPLEVIFRLGLVQGNSFKKRASGNLKYLRTLGLNEIPEDNTFLSSPIVEFSTKLEPGDRYLTYDDAKGISNLSDDEFKTLIETTQILAVRLHSLFQSMGLDLWDGKFEFAWDENRNLMLVDTIGLDELRVLLGKKHLSKEYLRQYYAGTKWQQQLDYYKSTFKEKWKVQMLEDGLSPLPLDEKSKELATQMYQSFCNSLAMHLGQKQVFSSAWDLRMWQNKVDHKESENSDNVLVIGSGGREHALSWKISKSVNCNKVFVAPGNPAMQSEKVSVLGVNLDKDTELINFVTENEIKLVVIGPEAPLVEGLADVLRKEGITVFGPSKEGALLEASKAFSKKIMQKANIPTARYEEFSDAEKAFMFVNLCDWKDGIVVKIDGLAAGKGVVVCNDKNDARKAIKELMIDNILNLSDTKVILEERLIGKEVSAFALIDGKSFKSIGQACDYKRIRDYDEGPNTGGMGTYSPCDWLTDKEIKFIDDEIMANLVDTLEQERIDYRGVIFVGLMKTSTGLKVLEFNVRFGDPETQSLLPRIKSDFYDLLLKTSCQKLNEIEQVEFHSGSAVHVVAASFGYPGTEGVPVRKGDKITISQEAQNLNEDNAKIFFAGVAKDSEDLVTNGGRVLGISAFGDNKESARSMAYEIIKHIRFEGMQYRGDIAK